MANEPERSILSGLSPGEAKEFNRIFVISFCVFMAVAIVAHILAWMWKPWGGTYHTAALDGLHMASQMISALT